MAIELVWFTGGAKPTDGYYHYWRENVIHFGTAPPDDKPNSLRISAPNVAEHHAKLFWSQGRYWLVNLCGLPCMVLKASGRTVPLTILEPAVEIESGEEFQISDWTFRVQKLEPPEHPVQTPSVPMDPQLAGVLNATKQPIGLSESSSPEHPVVWQTVLRLSTELLRYGRSEEMWHRTVDRLAEGFDRLWSAPRPALLVAVGVIHTGNNHFQTPILKCRIPRDASPAGEQRSLAELTGLPLSLPETLAAIVMEEVEPQHVLWARKDPPGIVHLLAGRVLQEAIPAGAIAVACQWGTEVLAFPAVEDRYLFSHLVLDLGRSLTFLEERKRAIVFERVHDLGSAVQRFTHDEAHVIELAERELQDMQTFLDNECQVRCPEGSGTLSRPLKKAQTIARQVRGIARAALHFAREYENRLDDHSTVGPNRELPKLGDCSQVIKEWLEQTKELNNDRYVCVLPDFELGNVPLYADCDEVLAALRNLEFNALNALKQLEVARKVYQVRINVEIRRLEEPRIGTSDVQYVVITVADNGVGMPARIAEQVFRGRVMESASGHGLGTQIVRWVMDQHRGLIRFSTVAGRGTVVELWFPKLQGMEPPLMDWQVYETIRQSVGEVKALESHKLLDELDNALPCEPHPS